MDSMTNGARGYVVGVDAHTDTHDAAVLDDCGRLLGTRSFPADATGYRGLTDWIARFGPIVAIGVESTGSYAAGLVRHLRAEGLEALEVNQPHAHTRRRRGKSDPIDAEMAARHVLAASRPVIAKDTTGIVEAIRQLRVARDGAVKARSAALNALTGLAITPRSSCASSSWRARRPAAARRSARASAPTRSDSTSPSTPPRPRCGRSRAASSTSTPRSRRSIASSNGLSPRRHPPPRRASPSPPATPARCW
jgi:transposase